MRILTVSATPYLITRLGRINSDIIRYLKSQGHVVGSAVWQHDRSWFLTDDKGISNFIFRGEKICDLYVFSNSPQTASPQVYEIMKRFQPDIVISIGDYDETDFIYAIKRLYPDFFKWIAILTIDAYPVNEKHKDAINAMDVAICTNMMGYKAIKCISPIKCEYVRYGPDDIFKKTHDKDNSGLRVMSCAKNSQSANPASFILGVSDAIKIRNDITGYLHTNLYDPGDYDIRLLINRYGKIELPKKFVGLNDGITDEDLAKEYCKSDVFVDVPARSSTGLSILESMSCGCIPVGNNVGAVGEILSLMPEKYRFIASSYGFMGANEEIYQVVSWKELAVILANISVTKYESPEIIDEIRKSAIEVAAKFSKKIFLEKLKEMITFSLQLNKVIVVESF